MAPIDKQTATKIVRGEENLLGVEEIISRLGISRSTLDRWVKKKGFAAQMNLPERSRGVHNNYAPELLRKLKLERNPFPDPDIYLGSSPKWLESTVIKWLMSSSVTQKP